MTPVEVTAGASGTLGRILEFLSERTGIVVPPHRRSTVEEVVRERARQRSHGDLEALDASLRRDAAVFDELAGDLTIGETYFHREAWALRRLRSDVLPALRDARPSDSPIRVWSAGCASGEETYSIAMVGEELGLGDRLDLIGTDISRDALVRARAGRYREWSLRGEGRVEALRHLRREGDGWHVPDRLRRRVRFQYQNLALDHVPSFASGVFAMDVVFCRNVLVYFDPATVARVARKLYDALADGGVLFLAVTDPPIADAAPFEVVRGDDGTYYRRPPATLAPPAAPPEPEPEPEPEILAAPPSRATPRSPVDPSPPANVAAQARAALARGDLVTAARLSADRLDVASLAVIHLRATAGLVPHRATALADDLAARHPLAAEIHYLRAILSLEEGRLDVAADAARSALYLDRGLAAAHFALATILERSGDLAGARRAYRNARERCRARPPDEPVPFADGEPAARLAEVAAAQLALLGDLS